ncbi:hypothetical protein [Planctomycetes bacterium Poly30]|uniref:hypothetical protein n=1 Tax=Saltatorellus ferox TaxID=2528018 RepID=UPI0011AACBD9
MKPKRGDHNEALESVLKRRAEDPTFGGQVSPEHLEWIRANVRAFNLAWAPIREKLNSLGLRFSFESLKEIDPKALRDEGVLRCLADGCLSTDRAGLTSEIIATLRRGGRSLNLQRTLLRILRCGVYNASWENSHREQCGLSAASNLERAKLYPEIAREVAELATSVPFWSVGGVLARALAKCDDAALSLDQIDALAQHEESGLAAVAYIVKQRRRDAIGILTRLSENAPDKYIARDAKRALKKLEVQLE